MDLEQIENIVAIEEEESISKAAEKLFITQSALNQQLLRLEGKLGVKLFERKHHHMKATYAGRIYLDTAHKMIDMKAETYKKINDITNQTRGEISVSYTPERGSMMFSTIYPAFHKKYPEITFRIREERVKRMEQLLLQHNISLAFMSYTEESKNIMLEYEDMGDELIVLAVPVTHPLSYLAGKESHRYFPEIDLNLFRTDQFTLPGNETLSRFLVDNAFARSGFRPNVLFESSSTSTLVNMVKQQICPAFFPQSYVEEAAPMVYFSVNPKLKWTRAVSYCKGTYISKAERYLIALAKGNM